MAGVLDVVSNGGAALAVDPDPNTTAPSRTFTAPTDADESGLAPFCVAKGGTSCSVRLWYYDRNLKRWMALGTEATACLADQMTLLASPGCPGGGVEIFVQVTSNTGVTYLGTGFGTGGASSSVSNLPLNAGETALAVEEQDAAIAEDNVNGVIATQDKPLATNTYAASLATNFGAAAAGFAKAAPGNVFSFHVTNKNAAMRYFQIHNKTSAPANPDVPLISIPLSAGSATVAAAVQGAMDLLCKSGLYCSVGIAWGFSTTEGTYTAATAADHNMTMFYK